MLVIGCSEFHPQIRPCQFEYSIISRYPGQNTVGISLLQMTERQIRADDGGSALVMTGIQAAEQFGINELVGIFCTQVIYYEQITVIEVVIRRRNIVITAPEGGIGTCIKEIGCGEIYDRMSAREYLACNAG